MSTPVSTWQASPREFVGLIHVLLAELGKQLVWGFFLFFRFFFYFGIFPFAKLYLFAKDSSECGKTEQFKLAKLHKVKKPSRDVTNSKGLHAEDVV